MNGLPGSLTRRRSVSPRTVVGRHLNRPLARAPICSHDVAHVCNPRVTPFEGGAKLLGLVLNTIPFRYLSANLLIVVPFPFKCRYDSGSAAPG
jgi:hypothetical protein